MDDFLQKLKKVVCIVLYGLAISQSDYRKADPYQLPCNNSFYSNPCSVKSVEYLKFFFISLCSPFATLERDILKLTKGCSMGRFVKLTNFQDYSAKWLEHFFCLLTSLYDIVCWLCSRKFVKKLQINNSIYQFCIQRKVHSVNLLVPLTKQNERKHTCYSSPHRF